MSFTFSPMRRLLRSGFLIRCARSYSAAASPASLIRVTDLPAPNSGYIRILELNRPEARNAISAQLLADLRREVDTVAAQYGPAGEELAPKPLMGGAMGENKKGVARAVILASAVESCFCAGADLKERKAYTPEE